VEEESSWKDPQPQKRVRKNGPPSPSLAQGRKERACDDEAKELRFDEGKRGGEGIKPFPDMNLRADEEGAVFAQRNKESGGGSLFQYFVNKREKTLQGQPARLAGIKKRIFAHLIQGAPKKEKSDPSGDKRGGGRRKGALRGGKFKGLGKEEGRNKRISVGVWLGTQRRDGEKQFS